MTPPPAAPAAPWRDAADVGGMIDALCAAGVGDDALRWVACQVVRLTPATTKPTVYDLLDDERSRTAIAVAERHALGLANNQELAAARDAARDAAWAVAWAVVWAAQKGLLCELFAADPRLTLGPHTLADSGFPGMARTLLAGDHSYAIAADWFEDRDEPAAAHCREKARPDVPPWWLVAGAKARGVYPPSAAAG